MSFIYIVYYLEYSFSNRNDGMILRRLWLYIFLFLCFTVQAQRRVEITGKVIDSEGGADGSCYRGRSGCFDGNVYQ